MSCANAGSASDPAAISVARNKTLYAGRPPASRRVLWTAQQGRHLVFEIFKAALRRAARPAARSARCAARRGLAAVRAHRRAPTGFALAGRPAQRGFQPLRHLGEILVGAGLRRGRRRRRRRAAAAVAAARSGARIGGAFGGSLGRGGRGIIGSLREVTRDGIGSGRSSGRGSGRPPSGSGAKPANGSVRSAPLGTPFRHRRRRRAAHFVGKGGPGRPRRRLGHLRLGVVEHSVAGGLRRRSSRRRAAARSGAAARRRRRPAAAPAPVRAWRARYWVRRRCRSGRRSSADVRCCRAAPAPAGGGHRPRRRRSPPAAASARDWCWRRGGCWRIGEPARRRRRSAPARRRMRRRM